MSGGMVGGITSQTYIGPLASGAAYVGLNMALGMDRRDPMFLFLLQTGCSIAGSYAYAPIRKAITGSGSL